MRMFFLKFLLFGWLFLVFPSGVLAEEISSFSADVTVNKSGTIEVTETITYDFGDTPRHGIFRTIPLTKTNAQGQRFRLGIDTGTVSGTNGTSYPVTKTIEDNKVKLRIGDPTKTTTGRHTYVIPYTVAGALTYFSDHDELYWNVTGNAWEVPISRVEGRVRLPEVLGAEEVHLACYTGPSGSTREECSRSYTDGTATFTASLAAGENLTIVVGFPKDIVAVLAPTPEVSFWQTIWGKGTIVTLVILAVLWYLVLPIKIIIDWVRRGRDPKAAMGVASAWFSPPKTPEGVELTAAETGTLVDERADLPDIVATIVDLARRGFVRIKETKKGEFTLEQTREYRKDTSPQPFERTLLSGLFAKGKTFTTTQGSLVTTIASVNGELYQRVVAYGFFEKNPHTVRQRYTILGIVALATGNIPLSVAAFVFGRAMPRKTLAGSQAANVARSLKNFLTREKRYLTFQADKQLLFEKLLPFAIAFGVEQLWVQRFAELPLRQPEWYQGPPGLRFTAGQFTRSLHSSFASSVSRAATPTSSSRGFSSGFSGGSSGGGGGGGGGGSW